MSITKIEELEAKWGLITSSLGYQMRLDCDHPLDFFIGLDENGNREIVLITVIEPQKVKSSKSIQVEKGIRADGRWATQIILTNSDHEDVFKRLCWDLVESSFNVKNELEGIETVVSRFARWQKLLETGNLGMSFEAIKGLIGELIIAREVLQKRIALEDVIGSWLGPNGSDRDFVFGKTWVEVKAISTGKSTVGISSLNQLDTNTVGTLAIVPIDLTSETDLKGFSFLSVIDDVRLQLKASPMALLLFEEKIAALGYQDRKEYGERFFTTGCRKYFRVDLDFPRLTCKDVRKEIAAARYELTISELENWEIEECGIWI